MSHPTASQRRATLERIVVTPKTLPAFDFEAFRAKTRADQQMLWRHWTQEERMRCAHAAMRWQHGHSDDALVGYWYEAMDAKLG
jgi:hypothetical protein